LAREARLLNTRQAFVAVRTLPETSPIVLVDDVVTTGATIRACALALRRAGFKEVAAIVVARTLRLEAVPRTG